MSSGLSEDIKECLFVETYNIEKRNEMLSNIVYVIKADQMLVFRLSGHDELLHQDCGYVTNEHLQNWGVSVEELETAAWENMIAKRPPVLVDLEDVIYLDYAKNLLEEANILEGMAPELQRFALTNKYSENGASYMWHTETMEKVAEKLGGNVIITPVSTHGLAVCLEADKEIVSLERENLHHLNSCMSEEDFLSNEVYRYDRENKEIEIAPESQQTITVLLCM